MRGDRPRDAFAESSNETAGPDIGDAARDLPKSGDIQADRIEKIRPDDES